MYKLNLTPPAIFFWCAFVIAVVFSQLLGQKVLWNPILPAPHARHAARVIEEWCELLGYLVVLYGAIECLNCKRKQTAEH